MLRLTINIVVFTLIAVPFRSSDGQETALNQSVTHVAAKSGSETPSSDRQKVTKTASMLIPTEKSIEKFRKRLEQNQNDYRSANVLGRLYMRQAKENDDFEAFIRAENVFRASLEINPDLTSSKAYLAEAFMAQHRFAEAEQLATEVVATDPRATLSLGTLGDAHIQLGNYDKAEQAYQQLIEKSTSPPVLVRLARLKELKGQVNEAIELITRAVQIQKASAGVPATEAWYVWRLGNALLLAGKSYEAKEQFQEALELNPVDAASLSSLAFIAATSGNLKGAVELYQKAIDCSEEPPILAALGDVYARMDMPERAEEFYGRAESLMDEEAKHPKAGPAHARERATYFADHDRRLPHALELARKDLNIRKDIYAYDTLAWALYKNHRFDEAADASKKALSHRTQDPNLFFHAGVIAVARGEVDEGTRMLKKALVMNPGFSILGSPIAREVLDKLAQ